MATGDRYKMILESKLEGQTCLNVFFYEQTAGTATRAESLADALDLEVLSELVDVVADDVTYTNITIENLDNPVDFYAAPPKINDAGTQVAESLPPFAAWSFRLNRATMAVRHGQKRFVGIPEDLQINGVATSGALTSLADVATALGDVISDGTFNPQYTPRIAHRVFDTDDPPNLIDYTFYPIASVAYVRIGTQNTRKFGRGI